MGGLSDALGPQLGHLAVMVGPLVVRACLEPALAGVHENLHPALDLGLLEVVLTAHVHELRFALDHCSSSATSRRAVHRPVQSRRGTRSSEQLPTAPT